MLLLPELEARYLRHPHRGFLAAPAHGEAGRAAVDAGAGVVDEAAEIGTALALDVFAAAFHEEALRCEQANNEA